jgi:hypothetical protein
MQAVREMQEMRAIQAVLFPKGAWADDMFDFLDEHDLEPIKPPRSTKNFIRFRIQNPKKFNYFYTHQIHDKKIGTIDLVIGYN